MRKRRGEVTAIKDLFSKYRHTLIAPQKTVEMEVIRVVGEITGLTLKESQVTYTVSSRTVGISAPSLIKQEIKLKQTAILKELGSRLGAKATPQHIF
jgi:hypothetical protein